MTPYGMDERERESAVQEDIRVDLPLAAPLLCGGLKIAGALAPTG